MTPSASAPPSLRLANRGRRRRSPISLTPLIDVVFILLVFFMLASSFLDWRAIGLNAPGRAAAAATMEGTILVDIRPDGLRLAGRSVSLRELVAQVSDGLRTKPDRKVVVRPDRGIVLQDAVAILDALTAAGVRDLSLIRKPVR
ncbi:MAG: biopolymer transporter ExbD [Alphaproteobacteria bacterium]